MNIIFSDKEFDIIYRMFKTHAFDHYWLDCSFEEFSRLLARIEAIHDE